VLSRVWRRINADNLTLIAAGVALPDVLGAVTQSLEELIPSSRCSVPTLSCIP